MDFKASPRSNILWLLISRKPFRRHLLNNTMFKNFQRLITNSQYSIFFLIFFLFIMYPFSLILLFKKKRKRSSTKSHLMKSKTEVLRLSTEFSTYLNSLKIPLSSVASEELAIVKIWLSWKIPCAAIWEGKCWQRIQ